MQYVAYMGEMRNVHSILIGKLNRMRRLGRNRWEYNIKNELKNRVSCSGIDLSGER
jgi:uncharacterized protein (DUF934 family)